MASLRLIPKDSAAKTALGGSRLASEWLATRSGDPATIIGKGKTATIEFKFAIGGSLTSPEWSDTYSLTVNGTEILASDLESAIAANLKHNNYNVVLVSCEADAQSSENFYAFVEGRNENWYPPLNP